MRFATSAALCRPRRRGNRTAAPTVGIQPDVLAPIVEAALTGDSFSEEQQRILEDLGETGIVLRRALETRLKAPPPGIPEDVFALILEAEAKLAGWCSREKALVIARTVLRERPNTCVEIGVFGGRSLVPCAAALRHIGSGEIYGIEAWSPAVAIENVTNEANDDWWSKIDFAHIKQEFYRFVAADGSDAARAADRGAIGARGRAVRCRSISCTSTAPIP